MSGLIHIVTHALRTSFQRPSSARRRRAVLPHRAAALVDVLEARLMLAADLGHAPDSSADTGVGDYQTLVANDGPRHLIDQTRTKLFLGARVDGDEIAVQGPDAAGDDRFTGNGRDDEDGVLNPLDLLVIAGASPAVTLIATNTTGRASSLYGWIDLDRNGVFDNATERTQVAVPSGAKGQRFTLKFPVAFSRFSGQTIARFRLSSDNAAANSTGAAKDGEVEDYRFTIRNRMEIPATAVSTQTVAAVVAVTPEDPSEFPQAQSTMYFGADIANVGDLDQNGVEDIVVTDPFASVDGDWVMRPGVVHVVFRNTDGTAMKTVSISDNYNGGPDLFFQGLFGESVESLGDIDGDGITDLAIGAPTDSTRGAERGAVYIVRLNSDGTAKSTTKIADSLNGGPPLRDGDCFGNFITTPGDLDGDGVTDLVVSAVRFDQSENDRVTVYTLFMNPDGTVRSYVANENPVGGSPSLADHEYSGAFITSIGDIDRDGVADLASLHGSYLGVAGLWISPAKQIDILFMNANGKVKRHVGIRHGLNGGLQLADLDGILNLTSIGDINADGINDIGFTVSDRFGDHSRFYSMMLTPAGTAASIHEIDFPQRGYGSPLNNLGDTNGDGLIELAWSVTYDDGFDSSPEGSVQIISLANVPVRTAPPAVPVIDNSVKLWRTKRPTVGWNAVSDTDHYEIWFRNQTTGVVLVSSAKVRGTTYTPASDLAPGKYNVTVRSINEVGASAWSARYDFTVARIVRINPLQTSMKRQPKVSWNQLSATSTYEVWISEAKNKGVVVVKGTTAAGATSFVPQIPLANGNYKVQVREISRTNVVGPWSEYQTFTIAAKTTVTQVSRQITNMPVVEWESMPGAEKYEIWIRSVTSPSNAPILFTTSQAVTTYQSGRLSKGLYRAWVRGVAADGTRGEWSDPRLFSSLAVPEMPLYEIPLDPIGRTEPRIGSALRLSYFMPAHVANEIETYDVWVDDPTAGLTPATSVTRVNGPDYSLDLTMIGRYRVWIRAVMADGTVSGWSTPMEIVVREGIFHSGFSSADVTHPEFHWFEVPGAISYTVSVASAETNQIVLTATKRTIGSTYNSYKLEESLPVGSYRITITGQSFDGFGWCESEPLFYNSELGPKLSTIQPGLESDVELEWTAHSGSGSISLVVLNIRSNKIVYERLVDPGTTYDKVTLPDGNYRWWAMAIAHNMWSVPGEFVVKRTTSFNNPLSFSAQGDVTLSWDDLSIADHYDVWVSDERGVMIYRNEVVNGLRITLPSSLPAGNYRAWVRAISGSGITGPWSRRLDFSIQQFT